jgi:hypothetical protein
MTRLGLVGHSQVIRISRTIGQAIAGGSSGVVMVVVWSELAGDAGGILLFLVWLVVPLLYVVAFGRRYVRQSRENAEAAVWARDEVCRTREEQREGSHGVDAGD